MTDTTPNPTTDDTEGNTACTKHAPIVTDVEGNSMHWSDAEIKHDVTPVTTPKTDDNDNTDDTDGNRFHFGRREDSPVMPVE